MDKITVKAPNGRDVEVTPQNFYIVPVKGLGLQKIKNGSKTELIDRFEGMIEAMMDSGEYDPLEVGAVLYKLSILFDTMYKRVQPFMVDEVEKYTGEKPKVCGIEIGVSAGRGRYDYSGNPEHARLKAQLKSLEESMKAALRYREQHGGDMSNPDGEVVPPASYTAGKSSVRLSWK